MYVRIDDDSDTLIVVKAIVLKVLTLYYAVFFV